MLRLPLDLSTFQKLIESDYLYVDKTRYAYDLITGGRRYFLSRPRRFGKSLFVSTLHEILKANRLLFDGLWINSSDYKWESYAVISLDLSNFGIDSVDAFKENICYGLQEIADEYQLEIKLDEKKPEIALRRLVKELRIKFKRVAVLIDEYDHPILQALKNTERAGEIRDALRRFFAAIKGLDSDIDFVFITGVSSFAKAGLFSGMNNLRVITLNENFAAICGYSDDEVNSYFSEHINKWALKEQVTSDVLRQQIREWYNGYSFGKNVCKVYNPFSLMNAIEDEEFKNYWVQTGTPTFLVDILKKEYTTFDPDRLEVTEDALGALDVGAIPLLSLMFQSGYLTIIDYDKVRKVYKLGWPNSEVKTSFQKYLLAAYANIDANSAERISLQLQSALNEENIVEVMELLERLFAQIPYLLHTREEKYYHSLLIMACITSGIKVLSDSMTSDGRIDMVLDLPRRLYVVEIKFNQSPDIAIKQIKDKEYFKQFDPLKKPIVLLGLSFNRSETKFNITHKLEHLKRSQ